MKKAAIFDLDGTLSDSIMSMKYSGDKTKIGRAHV